ncbi:DNA polymerase Y family protein [Flavobacterium sp. MXW15]|uniref:DNA polymerase Y family protein n=1 Tax=Xanthomonas chitinilytica TaxID=2989819 RepID=A0ABT3JYH9_9XANT|nr:DNA polymerase Y family protein [Xanthomonas sp. H13-6]MCW4455390.1 DNA polymerase Y family protein [Flavobacterium sp. MXW15]MCW4473528.1 DNA polymerase Y family protein [Xanthomonas sp. H13-6]
MRWACILLPHLALDGVLRGCADPAAPRVLLAGPAQRRVLHAVNPAAAALGLKPGLSLTAAQALARGFECSHHEPADEARWHALLAAWAYRFSSQVSLQYAQALIVEIEGSLGLFGPWPRFEARLRAELSELGFRHRIVLAPNPVAARALANRHDGLAVGDRELRQALAALPVARAGFAADVAGAFARMGLRTLRQLLALPREGIARRFPPQVLQHLDALLGERPFPLRPYRPPEVFEQRIELGYEVESSQALLFPLRRLVADLAAFLAGRDGSVQRFALRLEHEDCAATTVTIGLLAAERDPALLFEIARSRLEQAQLPAPVRALCLHADQLPAFVPAHRELFEQRPQQSMPWEQLRERLRARLGEQAVHGLRTHADHRPEQAWRNESDAGKRAPIAVAGGARPGWLLPAPVPWPGAAPRILEGPERIESGWWDGADLRRDYYRVGTQFGQQAWAWREVGGEGGFMLHGWFA